MAPYTPQCITAYLGGHSPAYPAPHPIDDPNWWRRYRNAYFRMIEMVDAQIGIVLESLRSSGQYDDTLVLFISDHGDCAGAHQWLWKNVLYEEAVKVPFILKPPSGGGAGLSEALVSTGLDILPTFCDYAGIDAPGGLQGSSLRRDGEPRLEFPFRSGAREHAILPPRLVRGNRRLLQTRSQGRRAHPLLNPTPWRGGRAGTGRRGMVNRNPGRFEGSVEEVVTAGVVVAVVAGEVAAGEAKRLTPRRNAGPPGRPTDWKTDFAARDSRDVPSRGSVRICMGCQAQRSIPGLEPAWPTHSWFHRQGAQTPRKLVGDAGLEPATPCV